MGEERIQYRHSNVFLAQKHLFVFIQFQKKLKQEYEEKNQSMSVE